MSDPTDPVLTTMTVGDLRRVIERHELGDDAPVIIRDSSGPGADLDVERAVWDLSAKIGLANGGQLIIDLLP